MTDRINTEASDKHQKTFEGLLFTWGPADPSGYFGHVCDRNGYLLGSLWQQDDRYVMVTADRLKEYSVEGSAGLFGLAGLIRKGECTA